MPSFPSDRNFQFRSHQPTPIPIANYSYCYNHRSPDPPSAQPPPARIQSPRLSILRSPSSVHWHRRGAAARLDSRVLPSRVRAALADSACEEALLEEDHQHRLNVHAELTDTELIEVLRQS
ncbi:unnamed protein product [Urochloa humidicola]